MGPLVAPFEIARPTVECYFLCLGDLLLSHSPCRDIANFYPVGMSRRRSGKTKPHVGADIILRHTFPLEVHPAEIELGFCIPLRRRQSIRFGSSNLGAP